MNYPGLNIFDASGLFYAGARVIPVCPLGFMKIVRVMFHNEEDA